MTTESEPGGLSDDALLDLVREALAGEVPEHHVDMVMTGYDLRDPDALLAELTHDSAEEPSAMAGLRTVEAMPRGRTFAVGQWTIDFEVHDGRVAGQIVPPALSVALESPRGVASGSIDDLGQFEIELAQEGPARLRFDTVEEPVVTAWFLL